MGFIGASIKVQGELFRLGACEILSSPDSHPTKASPLTFINLGVYKCQFIHVISPLQISLHNLLVSLLPYTCISHWYKFTV